MGMVGGAEEAEEVNAMEEAAVAVVEVVAGGPVWSALSITPRHT